jgi:hypothetical protein
VTSIKEDESHEREKETRRRKKRRYKGKELSEKKHYDE